VTTRGQKDEAHVAPYSEAKGPRTARGAYRGSRGGYRGGDYRGNYRGGRGGYTNKAPYEGENRGGAYEETKE